MGPLPPPMGNKVARDPIETRVNPIQPRGGGFRPPKVFSGLFKKSSNKPYLIFYVNSYFFITVLMQKTVFRYLFWFAL